jgi:hypothetical protein
LHSGNAPLFFLYSFFFFFFFLFVLSVLSHARSWQKLVCILLMATVVRAICDCAEEGKPTHVVDITKAAENILKVEVVVTNPPPTLRKGKSGPGLRMEYKAKVVQVIKGCITPTYVDIKQLVFNECPPPTLQGVYYISGAMGGKRGKTKHENIFYLDPCGLAIAWDSPVANALETYGNDCTGKCYTPSGPELPVCDGTCDAVSCGIPDAQCLVSRCGATCLATWVSNGTSPTVLCPSGLPAGAIGEAIENLEERAKLLVSAREAFKLGKTTEGFQMLASVAKLSAGGEEYRVPPTTTTVVTTPPAVDDSATIENEKPAGLQGLLDLAKSIPAVGERLDGFRKKAAAAEGKKFVPK